MSSFSIRLVELFALAFAVGFAALVAADLAAVESQQRPASVLVTHSTKITTTTYSSSSPIRLRANRVRRPEQCKDNLPKKSDDLPALVIVGRVKEVFAASDLVGGSSNPAFIEQDAPQSDSSSQHKALVNVVRVIKGNQQLDSSDVLVSGFNSSSANPCPNYVKPNDTIILLLNSDLTNRSYRIANGNLLAMNLNNLDKIQAIARDEPYRRRAPIDDILCEKHYCPYGRCKAHESGLVSCHCPDSCEPLPAPVCGSDNATYLNECELILEGCHRHRPLFVTKEAQC